MKKSLFIWVVVAWIFIVTASFVLNYYSIIETGNDKLLYGSRAFFGQIVTMREWNSNHGGVYVPVTNETQPNPYLKDSLRDVITKEGLILTKINPAYMTRQISELSNKNFGLRFHITSLKPIRPENRADKWESNALKSFESGSNEEFGLDAIGSEIFYRYMSPLIVQNSCLKCHAEQGYQLGDIRGGISVSIPYLTFLRLTNRQLFSIAIFHLIVLILGIFGLLLFYKRSNYYFKSLNNKNIELKNLTNTKEKIYSIIAHDLRSPFHSIIGMSELLIENRSDINSNELEQSLKSINITAKNSRDLLDNLLEWAKSQTGTISYNPEKVNINRLIRDIISLLTPSAKIKNITISIHIVNEIDVFADRNMLMTIFRNLISNAIKFTDINGFIDVKSEISGSEVIIWVMDNGVGIEKDVLEKLFMFNINHTTTGTMNEKGSGLGLVLTNEFLKINKGSIKVISEKNVGSTFEITLPLFSEDN
ncbi:MAG: DUF3365 domain-containing protein [Bacteroidales bacterium]